MGASESSNGGDITSSLKDYQSPVTVNNLYNQFVEWVTTEIWDKSKEAYFYMRANKEYTYIISGVLTASPYAILTGYAAFYTLA